MEHFFISGMQSGGEIENEEFLPTLDEPTDNAPIDSDPGIGYIFDHTKGKKCLVFVNSREECESVTTTLRRYCEEKGESD
ncbi:MAG: ATP-dependent helicase, partial [Oscillospiraceae bacterium]